MRIRRHRARRLLSAALLLAGAASCAAPEPPARPRRIAVLGLDGLDPREIESALAEGRMPAFRRLRDEGVCGELRIDPPLLSPVVWTTIATGRSPLDHGIGHFTARAADGREIPVTSGLRRVPALWNLWSDWGRTVGVVGWWATWPAEEIRGVLVSDRAGYHFLDRQSTAGGPGPDRVVHPPERSAELLARLRHPDELPTEELAGFVALDALAGEQAATETTGFSFADDLSHLRWAVAAALSHRDLGLEIWRRDRPELLLVYVEGTDSISHLFGHLHRRSALAGELEAQRRRFGGAVGAAYDLADRLVADFLAALGEEATLVVLSDHGFRLGELPLDPSTTRDERRVSDRYHRDRGILCFWGDGIRAGGELEGARAIDVAPTLIALAGAPLSSELPGRPLAEALREPVASPRIERYPTRVARPTSGAEPPSGRAPGEEALLDQLRSLGYLGVDGERSSSGERNLAFVALRERRFREAARAFERLTRESPGEPALHTGLASALAGLEREAEARREFARALALDPLFVPALHNRGILEERLGRRDAAVADYRLALRFDPEFAPAKAALARLGEGSGRPPAANAGERAAQRHLEAGNDALRHGDYARAKTEFEAARALAPGAAAPLHGLANAAYLAGDRAAAVRHLEAALAIEPENALFRANLQRLLRPVGAPVHGP